MEGIGILYSDNQMVSDHSNFILKHYLGYSEKTRMPVFDPYTAREEAEDHTTSRSGRLERMKLLSGKRLP